jgi:hypothetical protein
VQGALVLVIWAALTALAVRTGYTLWAVLGALPVAAALFPLVFRPLHEVLFGTPRVIEGAVVVREVMTSAGQFARLAVVQGMELHVESEQLEGVVPQRRYRVYYAPVSQWLLSVEPA